MVQTLRLIGVCCGFLQPVQGNAAVISEMKPELPPFPSIPARYLPLMLSFYVISLELLTLWCWD
jgi:hypothetical protein